MPSLFEGRHAGVSRQAKQEEARDRARAHTWPAGGSPWPTIPTRDAFAAIEADLVAEWKRSFDAHERDNLWRAVNIMERPQAWLRSAASHDLTALRRQK